MLYLTDKDKENIYKAYKIILFNLNSYLQQYNVKSKLEYSKIIFEMLHSSYFSINKTFEFSNSYNYINFLSELS